MKRLFYTLAVMLLAGALRAQEGVTINGITWATRNVGSPGTFVADPEDSGGYYTFEEAQTVCPAGWRTPTQQEFVALAAAGNGWIVQNGVGGRRFESDNGFIFLPATSAGVRGYYWASDRPSGHRFLRNGLYFTQEDAFPQHANNFQSEYSVRCVRQASSRSAQVTPAAVSARSRNLERFAGQQGISYVYVSKAMLGLISGSNASVNGVDVSGLAEKLNALQVVSADRPEAVRRLRAEADAFPKADMEVLMQVVEGGRRTEFFTLKQGETITELLMLSDSGDKYTLLLI